MRLRMTMTIGEITAAKAAALHLICCLGLLLVPWLAYYLYSLSLVTKTSKTFSLLLIIYGPIVTGMYSLVRRDRQLCSYWRAVARGLLGIPAGAIIMAFGAIVLGAPLGIQYMTRTIYWSLLMSLFTFVPLACTFGSSREDWHRILGHFKPKESLDAFVSLPAYGSIIGAWFGAWPMPLDWERPWQEWPICVTYGAIAGYLIGAVTSVLVLIHRTAHIKED